jgi:F0F1-type ATP synthase membrane subunit b/b'
MEIFGKEFRTVDNGLDPGEVAEFLRTAIGSSEDSFKRLEQFSSLQAAAKAMDESIAQARRLAESAKKQAEAEARQESERTLGEARERAKEMVDRVKNDCSTLIDDVRTVLTDAINRAFEKAKETVDTGLSDLGSDVHRVGASHHNQILENRQQSDGSSLSLSASAVAVATPVATDEGLEGDLEPDLMDLQRSLADLENSLTSLHASKGIAEEIPIPESPEEPDQDVDSEHELVEEKVDSSNSDDDNRYIGEVLVAIPGGANESWMRELRQRILGLPNVRIKAESGVDDNTTVVTLLLEEPTALQSVLHEMPHVEKVVENQDDGKSSDKGRIKLLHRASKKLKQPTFVVELDNASSSIPVLM